MTSVATVLATVTPKNIHSFDFVNHVYSIDDIRVLTEACADSQHWCKKQLACKYFTHLCRQHTTLMYEHLHTIIPIVSNLVYDLKLCVSEEAVQTLYALYSIIQNRDLEPFIPSLIKALQEPETVSETIHQLSAIVFVQELRKPALSILVPLLLRGFQEKTTAIKRKCCVICENICKLIDEPEDVGAFLPQLLPPIQKIIDEVADPECRQVADRVRTLLEKIIETKKQTWVGEAALDEGIDLCDCEFSLAYGSRILLNRSR